MWWFSKPKAPVAEPESVSTVKGAVKANGVVLSNAPEKQGPERAAYRIGTILRDRAKRAEKRADHDQMTAEALRLGASLVERHAWTIADLQKLYKELGVS